MSNLGSYQMLTTVAKKVGGPKNLIALIACGGYLSVRLVEAASRKVFKLIKTSLEHNQKNLEVTETIYEIICDGKDSCGLVFCIGDKYKVLESDGKAVLIEKLGDKNNPYFVSSDFLRKISNFID